MNNVSHFKEILVHLKPNNFLRYVEQLTSIETDINAIDATKFTHENVKRPEVIQEEEEEEESESSQSENGNSENVEHAEEIVEPVENIKNPVENE